MSKYNNAINSNSLEFIKTLINQKVKILDIKVNGKWLTVYLSSGIRFSVLNNIDN